MTHIFLTLLNMSITAGWIVLAVILLRFFLRKAPRWISCLLWGLVALRLVLPFSVESSLSLIPDFSSVNTEIVSQTQEPADYKEFISQGDVSSEIVGEIQNIPQNESNNNYTPLPSTESTEKKENFDLFALLSFVWIGGFALMLIYTGASYIRVRRRVAPSIPYDKNIFICDEIDTPFILGVIKPRIYLPSTLSETDAQYVIAHEKAHLKRKDHLWKPFGFLLLSIYWFNPLLWVGYILLCRDIELACDEKVVKDFEIASKKDYSTALLNCSIPRKMISACPLAFGEVGVKARIKNVLSYKKPALWIICIALIACIVASVCLLTNPVSKKESTTDESISSESLSSLNCTFTAKELIYNLGTYSYNQYAEDAPSYQLTQNVLYEVNDRKKSTLGRTTPIELDEEHFDTRFSPMSGLWTKPYSLEEIKKNNLSAVQVETEDDFYQLLLQKDGSFLLVVGHITDNPITSLVGDISYKIRWIYTLEKEDSTFEPAGGFSREVVLSKSYTEIIDTIVNAYPWNRNDGSAPIPDFPNASYMYIRHNNLNEVGFSITDLDNNGVDELIISPMDKSFVYDVYTTVEGETVHLFSSGERYTHTLYEGGYVHLGWSGGASHSGHDFLKISDGKVEFIERITLDAFYAEESGVIEKLEDASDDNTFFKSKSEYTKDYIHISDDEALALIDSHLNKSEKLELYLIPLSNISTPESLTDAINIATVGTANFSDRATAVTVGTYSNVFHINNLYGNSVAELSEIFDDIKVTRAEKEETNADDITFRIESESACVIVSVYENDIIEVGNGYVSSDKGMAYYTSEGVYNKISSYYEELKAETEQNYTIEYIAGTFQYHCVIKANDGTILFDETSSRSFHIEAVDKDLIFLWKQAGTGTLTRGGQFYNLETKEISEPFQGMVDYCNGVVSNTGSGQITLTLLKDPSQVLIIDEFKYPVSSFIENIANAKFVNDGKQIKITYWTGEYQNGEETKKITELFDVTLNAEA